MLQDTWRLSYRLHPEEDCSHIQDLPLSSHERTAYQMKADRVRAHSLQQARNVSCQV